MRVLFTGGREYEDWKAVDAAFETLLAEGMLGMCEGGAPGLDSLARAVAKRRGVWCLTYWAPWNHPELLKKAGTYRNRVMIKHYQPHLVAAFPGGVGTAHMKGLARAENIPVREFGS